MFVANENTPIEKTLKDHTIRDAIVMLKDAQADVPFSLLQNAWSKIHDWDKDDYTDEDLVPLSTFQTPTDYYDNVLNDVQVLLKRIAPTVEMSTKEIEEWNDDKIDDLELDDDESDSEGEAAAVVKIPHTDAIQYVNELIQWCTQNEDVGSKHTSNLLSLRSDIVTTHTQKTTNQKSLTDYFK